MIAGAFEDRIALTIPEESGSGGAACLSTLKYHVTFLTLPPNRHFRIGEPVKEKVRVVVGNGHQQATKPYTSCRANIRFVGQTPLSISKDRQFVLTGKRCWGP